jgi:phosphorylase kinase alpha/beta subunit
MYYYVPQNKVAEERLEPGSQTRMSGPEGSEGSIFLWGQSLYIIAQLLTSALINVNEIDLVRRYLPSFTRPRRIGRYSAFQVWHGCLPMYYFRMLRLVVI